MRRIRLPGRVWPLIGTALLPAASACTVPDSFRTVTDHGGSVRSLFVGLLVISALVFLGVAGLLGYLLVRFRARPGDDEPPQTEGSRRLEIAWTAAPALLLVVVFLFTISTMRTMSSSAAAPLHIQVTGSQWWWEFRYPDSGAVTANEVHLPAGTPVQLDITSRDVIHSFWVPRIGWKMDAVPGKTNTMNFTPEQVGTYDGACSEYCGAQHAWMRISVVVEPRADFDRWLAAQAQPAATGGADARGQQIFLDNTCINCHAIRGTVAGGNVGPDLTHIGSRATIGAGIAPRTPENLAAWIGDARSIKPGVLMPPYTFSDDDLRALAAFLNGLK
jgi:cytochrome c oxidase subunit 2